MGAHRIKQQSLAKTTGQSLLSLAFNLGGIFAGFIITLFFSVFSLEPWIIPLYPGIISIRGVIGGVFSGRLSTSLHLGSIEAKVVGENTHGLYRLLGSIVVLAFESSILLGASALLFNAVFVGISVSSAVTIFGVLIATMALSLLAISPLTIVIAFSSFKRGLDPDIIIYPVAATVADILVTLCYILILGIFFFLGFGGLLLSAICITFLGVVLVVSYKNREDEEFVRTLREAIYMLVVVAFIVTVTGMLLSRITKVVGGRAEIFAVYPALIGTMGAVGAIVGSTATTKLALGTLESSFGSIRNHRNQIVGAWIASAIMYILFSFVSSLYRLPVTFFSVLRLVLLLLATNVFAAVSMITVSFAVAILTFQRGLDPDNFVIPIESSLADTITTAGLFIMLSLIGGF
jgi:mgtE-like transporter